MYSVEHHLNVLHNYTNLSISSCKSCCSCIDTLEKVLLALNVGISDLMLGSDSIHNSIKQRAVEEFFMGISNLTNDEILSITSINHEMLKLLNKHIKHNIEP